VLGEWKTEGGEKMKAKGINLNARASEVIDQQYGN